MNTLSPATIEQRVHGAVARTLCVPLDQVLNEKDFILDLYADSLEAVEITMALEDEFGIEIPDHDAVNIKTVQQAIDYVTRVKA